MQSTELEADTKTVAGRQWSVVSGQSVPWPTDHQLPITAYQLLPTAFVALSNADLVKTILKDREEDQHAK